MKEWNMRVTIEGMAWRVEAETEKEAKAIIYDFCKNHGFIAVDAVYSEVDSVEEVEDK